MRATIKIRIGLFVLVTIAVVPIAATLQSIVADVNAEVEGARAAGAEDTQYDIGERIEGPERCSQFYSQLITGVRLCQRF
jgi:hypothetical protein